MEDLNKLTIIIIRLQSLAMILAGVIHWCVVAGLILIDSVRGISNNSDNYIAYFVIGITYIVIGIILYARSRSLADYFIRGVERD